MRILPVFYTLIVKLRAKKHGRKIHVNRFSIVSRSTVLGENVNFNGIRISGIGKVLIGSNFHSGRDCLMISQNHNYDNGNAIPYDNTYIPKDILIGDNVWLGDRVIVLGGAIIGEGAIIQAGSVVIGEIPPMAIAGGHPAKVFKYRDIIHYEKLKDDRKFL